MGISQRKTIGPLKPASGQSATLRHVRVGDSFRRKRASRPQAVVPAPGPVKAMGTGLLPSIRDNVTVAAVRGGPLFRRHDPASRSSCWLCRALHSHTGRQAALRA
jgi:hypothetical protein